MSLLFKPRAMTTKDLWEVMRRGAKTRSGQHVSEESAMRTTAVYACVRVIAETCAQLPLPVYQRVDGGKERQAKHWLTALLRKPNPWQNGFQFREMISGHVALRGNAYAFKNKIGGETKELIPLNPASMRVDGNDDGSPLYIYMTPKGGERRFTRDKIFHLMGLSADGRVGLSPVALMREPIGLAAAAEHLGASFFGNGAKPNAVFTHPKGLSDQAYKRLKDDLKNDFTGDRALETMLLEEGLTWTKVGTDPKDSQFIETRQLQVEEIARGFRMQLHKIGHLLRSTNNNIEHQGLEFVIDTMMPWFRRWEWEIWELLDPKEQETHFAEFLVDGLLRGDSKARAEYYKAALGDTSRPGWMVVDEIRSLENLNEMGVKTFPPLLTLPKPQEAPSDEPTKE